MKTVKVAAAVICDWPQKNKIFATARDCGEFKGRWGVPWRKDQRRRNTTASSGRGNIRRIGNRDLVGDLIERIEYDYPAFHLSMDCFWCEVVDGELKILEAEDAKWLSKNTLYRVQGLPPDITLIDKSEKQMKYSVEER